MPFSYSRTPWSPIYIKGILSFDEVLSNSQVHSCLVLVSNIFSRSNMTFPITSSYGKKFELGSCLLLPSLGNKHGKLGRHMNMHKDPTYKPYC